jgi:hypothetical protein
LGVLWSKALATHRVRVAPWPSFLKALFLRLLKPIAAPESGTLGPKMIYNRLKVTQSPRPC